MIRPAIFGDMNRLLVLMKQLHERSVYADREMDEGQFRHLCQQAIMQHHKGKGGCLFVWEQGGVIEGFIMGAVDRLYLIGKDLIASDLFTFTSTLASPRAAGKLIDAFIAWAKTVPGIYQIQMGVTGAAQDWHRAAKLIERRGFIADGAMFRMELPQCQAS